MNEVEKLRGEIGVLNKIAERNEEARKAALDTMVAARAQADEIRAEHCRGGLWGSFDARKKYESLLKVAQTKYEEANHHLRMRDEAKRAKDKALSRLLDLTVGRR